MKPTLLLLLSVLSTAVPGQTALDSLLERKVVNCEDVSVNAAGLIVPALINERMDSVRLVLEAWRSKCGRIEPVVRTGLLLELANKNISDTLFPESLLGHVLDYRAYTRWLAATGGGGAEGVSYDDVIRSWAKELNSYHSIASLPYAISEFYGTDTEKLLPGLANGEWGHTGLAKAYRAELARYMDLYEVHFAGFLGLWSPMGDLAILGSHPELGFQGGFKRKRMNYDLTIAFRTGSSAEPYRARRPKVSDSLEWTSHFFGGHVGLDLGWDLWSKGRHELQVNTGIAFDGFDAFSTDRDDSDRNGSASSLDLSGGATYRYYVGPYSYLGIQVKYHWVDYSRGDVVELTGQPLTLRVIYGGLINLLKRSALNTLQYEPRR